MPFVTSAAFDQAKLPGNSSSHDIYSTVCLFNFYTGGFDHLAPARKILADDRGELLRRVAHRLDTERRKPLLHQRGGERLHSSAVNRSERFRRHARRTDQAGEIVDLEIAQPAFGEGG